MYIKKIIIAILLIGIVIFGVFAYNIYNILFVPNAQFSAKTEEIFIKTGSSFEELISDLRPFLKDENTFRQAAQQKGYDRNVKAGRYVIKQGMTNNDLITLFRIGNTPVKVSFNNQERIENLAGRISQQIEADSLSLLEAFTETDFLQKNGFTPENALSMYIPNTYEFYWNTSAEQFRNRMLKEYLKFWTSERLEKSDRQGLTPLQVMSLAAIVQKETVKIDERPRVAGVYLNRLKKGMLLQADPTVIFAVKHHTNNYDTIIKRVYHKHLQVNSPYNTYIYGGVPAGIIAMPDISSIEAVLNPEIHDFYYFVADTENIGYHIFARTLEQHNLNSKKYHNWADSQKIK